MHIKSLLLLFLISSFAKQLSAGPTCRALVLEGGGDKGAYQAGALSQMFAMIPTEIQYDVMSGVSVGALNTAGLAMYAKGDEGNMTEFLLDIWRNIKASDVYQDWSGGIIDGILFRPSIYDTSPLNDFLHEKFTKPIQRKITIGTCNANNGSFVRFDESLSHEDLITAVRCSSAMPIIFPYVEFQNETYIDGGSVLNLDVGGAIERCREITDNDNDIIVDVILCTGAHLKDVDQSADTTLQMLDRYLQIDSFSNALDDLLHAKDDYSYINFRYIIMPSSTLPSGEIPLGFKPEQIEEMISMGQSDAKNVITNGTTIDWNRIQEQRDARRNKVQNSRFGRRST
jgi:predicted acylesterase/phospholipase RssA